jgi:hypothetical protein
MTVDGSLAYPPKSAICKNQRKKAPDCLLTLAGGGRQLPPPGFFRKSLNLFFDFLCHFRMEFFFSGGRLLGQPWKFPRLYTLFEAISFSTSNGRFVAG